MSFVSFVSLVSFVSFVSFVSIVSSSGTLLPSAGADHNTTGRTAGLRYPPAAMRISPRTLCLVAVGLLALVSPPAQAGPWTRDRGHFFVSTSYFRIAAKREGDLDTTGRIVIGPYLQHLAAFYGELGLIDRFLTVSVDGTVYRQSRSRELQAGGVGDWRIGFWSGLITRPVRLTANVTVTIPVGSPSPASAPCRDGSPPPLCLPNGAGTAGIEGRLSFGYGFGGWRYWPLRHYLVLETGYWARLGGFSDAFTFRGEFGVQLPWKGIRHFWFTGHISGLNSFASAAQLRPTFRGEITGVGNGISYAGYGFEIFARVVKGLGVAFGADSAIYSRLVPLGAQIKAGLSYEY